MVGIPPTSGSRCTENWRHNAFIGFRWGSLDVDSIDTSVVIILLTLSFFGMRSEVDFRRFHDHTPLRFIAPPGSKSSSVSFFLISNVFTNTGSPW